MALVGSAIRRATPWPEWRDRDRRGCGCMVAKMADMYDSAVS
jgi:hypothetical protein